MTRSCTSRQQGTRYRSRGPIRELFLAETYLDRSSWFCSELVVAAGTVAGLFSDRVKANVTQKRMWNSAFAQDDALNPKLADDLFEFQAPAGVRKVDFLNRHAKIDPPKC